MEDTFNILCVSRGLSSVWLEHMSVTHGVAGSSPVGRATVPYLFFIVSCFHNITFCGRDSTESDDGELIQR